MRRLARLMPLFMIGLLAVGALGQAIRSVAPPNGTGLSPERLERIGAVMNEHVAKGHIAGAIGLISRRGKVGYFETYGYQDREAKTAMRKDTIFRMYSMTKPITGVAVLSLYEEGKFSLNDPVSSYLPELANMKVAVVEADPQTGKKIRDTVPAKREITILDLMRHTSGIDYRGPDDAGEWWSRNGCVGLAHRRLSIIDLSAAGHQPMSDVAGRLTIVFNGEIYNFLELKPQLEAQGHRFTTHSDTEAIVHAYEEFGPECLQHLRGMFALAIWDERARRLFLARDRAGKKPLYYTTTPKGTLVFGSELKALLEHPDVVKELDPEALDAYLTLGYVPDPLSIFHDIHKLAPGHYLTFSDGVARHDDLVPQLAVHLHRQFHR